MLKIFKQLSALRLYAVSLTTKQRQCSIMADGKARSMEYWDDRWSTGRTGWHQSAPDEQLVANASVLLPPPHKYRVFVPLCGKSLDLLWLYKAGHTVVGVEGVERVVQEFGKENDIALAVTTLPWGKLYQSADARLLLYVCDLFAAPPQELGKFDVVFDRGSFVAINVDQRGRYAAMMKQLLSKQFRYLLMTIVYTPNEQFSGPPCALPTDEVRSLMGDVTQLELLQTHEKANQQRFKDFGVGTLIENILLLTPKAES